MHMHTIVWAFDNEDQSLFTYAYFTDCIRILKKSVNELGVKTWILRYNKCILKTCFMDLALQFSHYSNTLEFGDITDRHSSCTRAKHDRTDTVATVRTANLVSSSHSRPPSSVCIYLSSAIHSSIFITWWIFTFSERVFQSSWSTYM